MGDALAELGTYIAKVLPKGQKVMESKGKYVFLWKRTPEGWKVHWEVELEDRPENA